MSEPGASGIKHVYACATCGFAFYIDAREAVDAAVRREDGSASPRESVPCPQCGALETRLTFTLGGQCERADC